MNTILPTSQRLSNRQSNRNRSGIVGKLSFLTLLVAMLSPMLTWGQTLPFEVTTADDTTNHTEKFYWIESAGATGFYAVPHSNNQNASTTNAPTLRALWYFMESGESGYYYIINKETGKYLKKTGQAGTDNTIQVADYAAADDAKFKFSFDTPTGIIEGYWVIYPKEAGTAGWLSKKSGNTRYDLWLKVSNFGGTPVGDLNSQWKIVARDAVQWPQSGLPFVVSTSNNKNYYRINHAQSTDYNISYDDNNNVTISTEYDNKTAWYFEEVATDPNIDNLKYYYIVNASGKYLKFTAQTINGSNQNDKFTLSDYNSQDADRFQFVVVNSYGGNAGYSIMPKLAMSKYDVSNYANSMVPNTVANNEKLDLKSDRNNSNAHWNFVTTEYPMSCSISSITYDSSTGKITITPSPSGANIHYTTDGTTEPTSSDGTPYSAPFDVSGPITIKAIATKDGYVNSEVTTKSFEQVATPSIQDNGTNAISITCETAGATIRYTTDGSTPTTSSTEYTGPLTENVSGVTIKAIAVKDGMINSAVESSAVTLKCAKPVIAKSGGNVTISCNFPASGVSIYYTINGDDPTTLYSGAISVSLGDVIKAIAVASGYDDSEIATKTIHTDLTPTDGKYLINNSSDFEIFVDMANDDGAGYHYVLQANVNASTAIEVPFTGTFEAAADAQGNFYKISGLTHALFNTISGGTVKNVMLDGVNISTGTNVGAICNEATGDSRIYNCGVLATNSDVDTDDNGYTYITNCSSTISGSGYVGGIVGKLDGTSRVINCFSYANITGGSSVGGIVGYNSQATTSAADNQKTMVMNCMFYGDITGGSSKAPVYNGEIITNRMDENGVSNFNYFWSGASYVQNQNIDVYNCALAAETRFLQRFEFFRHLLNSNRSLAAWWATGSRDNTDMMLKWVMEPSQIGSSTPYPILKAPKDANSYTIKYPSVVNIDAENAESFSNDAAVKKTQYNQGRKFGTLTINIQMGTSGDGYHPAAGASITTSSITRNITDKDPAHFNYNYYKVQLPYYNEVGTNNYRKDNGGVNRVVTGWKIVSISDGTNSFTTGSDAEATVNDAGDITLTTPYNFADRKCTAKDLYSSSSRVFSQGAYFDVPEGVTSITIEPYWAKCVYVADAYPDVVYNKDMNKSYNVTTVGGGEKYKNNTNYLIAGENQKVYTTMGNAVTALAPSGTVYDNAIVLVGNVHSLDVSDKTSSKPYTIMSIDLDKDNEPDYSYILRFNSRVRLHPVRVDFLNIIGLGMAQKSNEGKGTYNLGIMQPLGWFESTNTSLFRFTQFEYDRKDRVNSPMILHGGVIEQWVTVGGSEQSIKEGKTVTYYHVGGNVWFKEFHIGVHQDKTQNEFVSPHPPISVTGGDFDDFYLTGLYNTPNNNSDDNAECYINGGRFGKVAGTGMQGIGNLTNHTNGNIIWQIDNADIDEFYAGGINAAHIAEGNIYTVISNSRVDQFCGGPKFGNMNSTKKVVTNASNCTFRTFFGAGYGGNSYNRRYPSNQNNKINIDWDSWLTGDASYDYSYDANYGGVETRIDYQFLPMSSNVDNVCRLFIDYVSFSLATTYDVTTKLTGCTITKSHLGRLDISDNDKRLGNFYGGGSLGKVAGPIKSSLINCTVEGNVFGAGYSATMPKVNVMANSFQKQPHYDENLGAYLEAVLPATTEYEWEHAATVNSTATAINTSTHKLYTEEDLSKSNLGSVSGAVTLTITTNGNNGTTTIGTSGDAGSGNVFGGGDESYVTNPTTAADASTTVVIKGNTEIHGNVFGGGNKGAVSGSTSVSIED